ncbi:MAG: hypothetical protein ACREKM_12800 [Longimicrobiales bacterium]
MREFHGSDGRAWRARLEEGNAPGGTAWEIVLFEPDSVGAVQRIVYRPAGWLQSAPIQELIAALGEAEAVRTRWG